MNAFKRAELVALSYVAGAMTSLLLRVACASVLATSVASSEPRSGGSPSDFVLAVATDYAVAVDRDSAQGPLQRALLDAELRWTPRHNYYLGDPIVALSGGAGWATADRVPFDVSARIGTQMDWFPGQLFGCANGCRAQLTGVLIGVRLDAVGERVPSTWTVPVDAFWYFPGNRVRIGIDGGVRWRLAGTDRALGWSAGLNFVARGAFPGMSVIAPRDVHVRWHIERLADTIMIGVSFGTSSSDRYDRAWDFGV